MSKTEAVSEKTMQFRRVTGIGAGRLIADAQGVQGLIRLGGSSSKSQPPNTKENPSIKFQTNDARALWMLIIGFLWMLELGIWSFPIPHTLAVNRTRTAKTWTE
jgi:hypothetical protein